MDEHAFDRAIDVAAGTLMAREPSRALGYNVMARVRAHAAPASRRFVWVAAAAGAALCAGIAMMFATRVRLLKWSCCREDRGAGGTTFPGTKRCISDRPD